MNVYETNLKNLTCSCEDWKQTKQEYPLDDPRRLCKHIINKLDINNLLNNLKYFKEDIKICQEKEWGFYKQFKKIITLLDGKYIALTI